MEISFNAEPYEPTESRKLRGDESVLVPLFVRRLLVLFGQSFAVAQTLDQR